jgi:xenotropic and polytropic retrovirus receptor 1
MMNEIETLYTNVFELGDRTRAMQHLRVPPLEEKQPRAVTFRLGMCLGKVIHFSVEVPLTFINIFQACFAYLFLC